MLKMNRNIQFLLIFALLLVGWQSLFAQGNTVYYMGTLPQAYYMNPATQPQCDVFIGIPAASQINARVTTGSLSAEDYYLVTPKGRSI